MPYFIRSTSSVPGISGYHHYGESPDEHLFVHRPAAIRANMPVVVYLKPGHSFNPGERVMDATTSSSPALTLAVQYMYETLGWPVVSYEIRTPHSADSPKREAYASRPWPGPILSTMKLIMYLRQNWNNETLWGAGGSIDRRKVLGLGSSSGHTGMMLAGLIPPGHFPANELNGLGQSTISGDHRPNAVAGFIGQIDWTQFALNPNTTSGPFQFDIMQYFHGLNGSLTNTNLSMAIKRSASPWFWLPYADPEFTAFWGSWGTRPTSGPGQNLTPADWLPNSIRSDAPNQKAFYDPHHYFQAAPFESELKRLGIKNRIIWGTSADNPRGPNNSTAGLTDATTSNDLIRWITNDLGWAKVV
jgi:hypothetical protein